MLDLNADTARVDATIAMNVDGRTTAEQIRNMLRRSSKLSLSTTFPSPVFVHIIVGFFTTSSPSSTSRNTPRNHHPPAYYTVAFTAMVPSFPLPPVALTAAQLNSQLDNQLTDGSNLDVDSQMSIARGPNAPPPPPSILPSFAFPRGLEEPR